MYIVREAGYDLRAARKLFIRMARTKQRAAAQGHGKKISKLALGKVSQSNGMWV